MTNLSDRDLSNAALARLRREFIPPQQYKPPAHPEALPEGDEFPHRVIKAMCDVMMKKLLAYRADPENRKLLIDVVTLCEALEQCGYRAHADLGRKPLVQATRINLIKEERHG